MPPRKAKKDPEVTKVAEELADPIKELIAKLKENILDAARKTATEESKLVWEKIPESRGRNTALDSQRHEIITPAGTAIPVPTLNPFKPFRTVHSGEEFAFSVNGSPLVLAGIAAANKKNTRPLKKSNPQKKTTAEAGLLVPKEEGTSV
ncbi:hypothetical protein CAEBREN_32003 [Caenorhabditis brenneri]|uniref:Uncharacterized protein n=1 Tax=Caenorhabditis brenneri TaxID=135651 RepID=G0P9A4_CAEBE|nr:hypothetical protein CAEBREN_32003 [Caenorhabditis brenneri]